MILKSVFLYIENAIFVKCGKGDNTKMIQMRLARLFKPVGVKRTFHVFPPQAHSFQLRPKYSFASLAPTQIMTQTEAINGFFPTNGHSKKTSIKHTNGKAMPMTQEELAILNKELKKMTEEIQTKVSTCQVSFIKELDELT